MSSPQRRPKAGNVRPWADRDAERKSGAGAGIITLATVALLHAVLLVHTVPPEYGEEARDIPLAMEIRRIPLPGPVVPVEKQEVRKLVAEAPADPERPKVAPPPEPVKPKPRPRRAPLSPKPPQPEAKPRNAAPPADDVPAGNADRTVPGVVSGTAQASPGARNDVLAALVRAIEANKRYPRAARRAGIEGSVALRVAIGPDGTVSGCVLSRACGRAILDDAARELGGRLLGLHIPAAQGRSITVTIPVHYSLTR